MGIIIMSTMHPIWGRVNIGEDLPASAREAPNGLLEPAVEKPRMA